MLLKSSKHLLQMVHMIFWGQVKINDVINQTFAKTKTYQNSDHDPLKLCKAILKTKWQKIPLVQIILHMRVNFPKCCLDLITFLQWQLMEARLQVQGTKNLWLNQGHQRSPLVGAWHIFLNGFIYSSDDNPHTCGVQSNC